MFNFQAIISFISSASLTLSWIFDVSCCIGENLVHISIWSTTQLWNLVTNFVLLVQILCDDYSTFLSDLWTKGLAAVTFVKCSTVEFTNLIINAADLSLTVGYTLITNLSYGAFNVFQVIVEVICFVTNILTLAYQSVSYIGSSVVTVFLALPENLKFSVYFVTRALLSTLKFTVNSVIIDFYGSGVSIFKSFAEALILALQKSTSSLFGFLIGSLTLTILVLYFKDIVSYAKAILGTAVAAICIFASSCWSGEFFHRQNTSGLQWVESQRAVTSVVEPRLSQTAEKDDNLCIVCLSNPKNVLHLPCRHVCVCQQCSDLLDSSCPVCRMRIRKKILVYL